VVAAWERVFWVAPAGEAAAWVIAAPWVLVPAGLVVCGGEVNGLNVVAAGTIDNLGLNRSEIHASATAGDLN
jgi:hypothetical protein